MIYSVWRPDAKKYDYYEAPGSLADDPKPSHLTFSPSIGSADSASPWPLPAGAKKTGSGDFAKGVVATGEFQPGSLGIFAVVGLAAFGAYKLFFKKRTRR